MSDENRFQIIFEKLADSQTEMETGVLSSASFSFTELDEISELRRYASEVAEPVVTYFTSA